jgi:hypothetical protein
MAASAHGSSSPIGKCRCGVKETTELVRTCLLLGVVPGQPAAVGFGAVGGVDERGEGRFRGCFVGGPQVGRVAVAGSAGEGDDLAARFQ